MGRKKGVPRKRPREDTLVKAQAATAAVAVEDTVEDAPALQPAGPPRAPRPPVGVGQSRARKASEVLYFAQDLLVPCAKKGDERAIAIALKSPNVDLNAPDASGTTAITAATKGAHQQVVALLVADKRVNANVTNRYGFSSLLIAAGIGSSALVQILLTEERVQRNLVNVWGNSALIYAADFGHFSVVKLLLADKHVDTNISDQHGLTALSRAATKEHDRVVELLLTDARTIRTRPMSQPGRNTYDAALRAVKRRRNARFKGLARTMVAFHRMRLRAAQAVYAPGGTGFVLAEANFNAAAAELQ